MSKFPDVGDSMPDMALETPDGGSIRPSNFAGRKLVVFFYPKDDTLGCTVENKDLPDLAADFEQAGTALLGVSNDLPKKHQKFAEKHGLVAPLATDAEVGGLSDELGVWAEKQNYGKTDMGMVRSTFLVDSAGRIARAWRKVKVQGPRRRSSGRREHSIDRFGLSIHGTA